jgi:TolB protein
MILALVTKAWSKRGRARHAAGLAMLAAGLLAGAATAWAQEPSNSGTITVPGSVRTINVSISGSTPALTALMTTAFKLHGAFHVAQGSEAVDYALRFDSDGGSGVTVTATPKVLGGTPVQETATGADWREAAYRAGDDVVQKLTGLPGFFAGKLAFASKRTGALEIFTSDLLGQEVLQRTNDHSNSLNPHWSPDGMKILYTSFYRTGFMELTLINVVSNSRRPFAYYKGMNTGGAFSPDGQHVAMILSSGSLQQLFVSDAAGSRASMRRVTNTPSDKASPTWSPDGTLIALDCDPRGEPLLYTISAEGGTLHPVSTYLSNYCSEAAWNPLDPSQLVFMAARGEGFQLALYNFKTHEADWLPTEGSSSLEPCWCNDGRHVIYTSRTKNVDRLAIVDTQTGHNAYLTSRDAGQAAFAYPK